MSLSTSSPNVTLLDTSLACGTAVAGTKLQKAFRVNLGSIATSTSISFNLTITGTSMTTVTQTINMTVGIASMNKDFELNNGNFTTDVPTVLPGWQYGITTKITENTTHLWGTDLTSTYPNNATWDLYSPSMTIGSSSTLSFWHYYLVEANYDGGVVYISTDGGANWTIISPNGGYPNSSTHLAISPAYSCSYPTPSTGITGTAVFDLSAYANQTVMFKWHFFSDIGRVYKGWFIDNVVVTNLLSGPVNKNGKITGTITLSPTSPNVTKALVKAGQYATHPASDGSYSIYLPNGTYSTAATLTNYSTPSSQSLTVSEENPIQTGNFSLEFLATPPTLSYSAQIGSIPLSWSARENRLLHFNHYNVYRRINADAFMKITEVTGTFYTDTPTINGTYNYYVTEVYAEGESGASNTVSFTYPPTHTAPNAVTLVSPANSATNIALLPTVSWTPNDSRIGSASTSRSEIRHSDRDAATVYYVYCDTNANPTTLVGSPTSSPFTFTTALSYGTAYYWKVVAHNAYGNSIGNTVRSFTTVANQVPLESPENVVVTKTESGVEITWDTVEDATIYRVYATMDINTSNWGSPIATVNAPNHSWTDATGSNWRFFKITADNPRIEIKSNQ